MVKTMNSLPTIYPEELARKGETIYQKVKDELEKEKQGKFAAIEVESGKYFIGDNQLEAFEKAKKHFPKKIFYFVKIGFPAVFTHSSFTKPSTHGSIL